MLPYLQYQTISLGAIKIQVWGLMFALAIVISALCMVKANKGGKYTTEQIIDFVFWALIGVIIGGRLGFIIVHPSLFTDFYSYFTFWDGGLALYGGFFGVMIFGSLFLRRQKIDIIKFADFSAPAIALGLAIGRIGCFLVGEHLGGPTSFFLGVKVNGQTVHQTSLYLVMADFALFLILSYVSRSKKFNGQIALLFVIIYSVFRFLIDSLRVDEPNWAGMTPSQWISVPLFLIAVISYIYIVRSNKKD